MNAAVHMMYRFSATIYKIGINPFVEPSSEVLEAVFAQAGRRNGPIAVAGRLNGHEFVQKLVKYGGAWRMYVNGKMLKDSALTVGDRADVEIAFDPRPRDLPVPAKFAKALEANAAAKKAFEELVPSRRKEILRYLGGLKTESSLERNAERLIRNLTKPNVKDRHVPLKHRTSQAKIQKKDGR
ncbi:MAG TPA: YdeI/OmpD-associated family protein [Pyrinomonadaceae bacterium]|nr:YdeI/OmpD-associated family protein [Pyrinomonadaceae bacterium]